MCDLRAALLLLFLSPALAFTTVPQANLVFNDDYPPIIPENTTTGSKPQVVFNVMNNGTRTAYIINSSLKTSQGYTLVQAPESISPGYTSSFVYEFTNFLCDIEKALFSFDVWYQYVADGFRNLTSPDYDLSVSGFLSLSNLQPDKDEIYVDIEKGDSISFLVRNDANQPVNFAFSVEYPEDFFLVFQTSNLDFERYEFEEKEFLLGPKSSQLFTIQIFPSKPVKNSYIRLRVYDSDCSAVSQSFEKRVNVVWVKEGLFTRNIVSGLDFLSVIFLFLFAFLIFSKIYY